MEVSSIKAEGNSPQKKLPAKFRRRAERLARRVGQVVDAYEQAQEEIRQLKRQLDSKLLEVANYQLRFSRLIQKNTAVDWYRLVTPIFFNTDLLLRWLPSVSIFQTSCPFVLLPRRCPSSFQRLASKRQYQTAKRLPDGAKG